MSEGKRIQLTSMTATGTSPLPIATSGGALLPPATSISGTLIGSSGANSGPSGHTTSAGNRLSSDFLPQAAKVMDKTNNSSSKSSTRLTIELFQSDSSKYPEFNYTRLLRLEKKKQKKIKQKNFNNPGFTFNNSDDDAMDVDRDDDVARIAREMERKYGSAYSSGGGSRSNKKRDTYDIGMGYDENDSFIDNTEAYDEIIPNELETVEGGFYINCGALIYKKLYNEQMNTKTDEIIKMPDRPKKMIISSSSEEDLSSSAAENDDDDDDDDNNDNEEDDDEEDEDDEDDDDDEDEDEDDKNDKNGCNTDNDVEKESTSTTAMVPTPLLTASATTVIATTPAVTPTTSTATLSLAGKGVSCYVAGKNVSTSLSDLPAKRKLQSTETITNVKKTKKDKAGSSSNSNSEFSSLNQHRLTPMTTDATSPVIGTFSNILNKERSLKKQEKTTTVKDMLKIQRDNFLKSQNTTITPIITSTTVTTSTSSSSTTSLTITTSDISTSEQYNTALKPAAILINKNDNEEKLKVQDKCTSSSVVVINLDDIHIDLNNIKYQQLQQQLRTAPVENLAGSGNGVTDANYESDSNSSNTSVLKQTQNNAFLTNINQLEDIGGNDKLRTKDTKLPQLDPQTLSRINDFRKHFQEKNLIGKKFKINEQYMTDLLRIDSLLVDGNNKTHRNNVFAHLEYQLLLPKYSLLRKIKQLRIKEEKSKQVNAFFRLQKSVLEVMNIAASNYEAEMRKYIQTQNSTVKGGTKRPGPTKKFPWNNDIKNQLFELFRLRCASYSILATRNESWEDFVCNFIRLKVLPIWPHEWMTYEELRNEIENYKNNEVNNYKEKSHNNGNNNNSNSNNCNINELSKNLATTSIQMIAENPGAINNFQHFNVTEKYNLTNVTTSIPTRAVSGTVPVTSMSKLSAGQEINNQLNFSSINYQLPNFNTNEVETLKTGRLMTNSSSSYKIHSFPTKQQFSSILEQQPQSQLQQQQQQLINNTSHAYKNSNINKTSPSNFNNNNCNKSQTSTSVESIMHSKMEQQALESFRQQIELLKNNNCNFTSKNIHQQKTTNSNNKPQLSTTRIMEEAAKTMTTTTNTAKHDELNSPDSEIEFVNVVYPATKKSSTSASGNTTGGERDTIGPNNNIESLSVSTSTKKKLRYIDTIINNAVNNQQRTTTTTSTTTTTATTMSNKHKQ